MHNRRKPYEKYKEDRHPRPRRGFSAIRAKLLSGRTQVAPTIGIFYQCFKIRTPTMPSPTRRRGTAPAVDEVLEFNRWQNGRTQFAPTIGIFYQCFKIPTPTKPFPKTKIRRMICGFLCHIVLLYKYSSVFFIVFPCHIQGQPSVFIACFVIRAYENIVFPAAFGADVSDRFFCRNGQSFAFTA